MTSPISLLAPLAGADPVSPSQPSTADPAVFAAALIAAIQLLQAPIPTPPVVQAPGVVEVEGDGEEVPQGDDPSSTAVQVSCAAVEPVEDAEPELDPPVLLSRTPLPAQSESDAPSVPDMPVLAGRAEAGAYHEAAAAESTRLDLISDEPAMPVAAGSAPKAATPRPVFTRPVAIAPDQPVTPKPEGEATDRLQPEDAPPWPRRMEPGTRQQGVKAAPAAAGRTERKANPRGQEKASRQPEGERQAAAIPVAIPAQGSLTPAVVPMPIPPLEPQGVAPPDNRPAESSPEAEHRSPTAGPPVATSEEVRPGTSGAQIQNARLAAQLAELVGDMNVTEFRVELARRRVAPAEPGDTTDFDTPAAPTVELDARVPAAPAPARGVDLNRPATNPEPFAAAVPPDGDPPAEGAPATARLPGPETVRLRAIAPAPIESRTPQPAALAEKTMSWAEQPVRPVARPSGPKADPAPGFEAPSPAVTRPRMVPAAPTLPAVRQELPSAAEPAADYRPTRTEARPTELADSSEPTVSASTVAPSIAERVLERNDGSVARGTREARNLPQDSTGNERPAGLADRVTVQVSDAEGRQTRIRVSVLGDQVRAVIVPPDPESARQLEQRMDDLQTALARQGFAGSKVSVQQPAEGVLERGGAVLAGLASGSDSRAATSPGRDQPAGDQRQGRNPREQQPGDGQRHPNGRSRHQGAEHRRR